jgi:hypothetical protein
MPNANDPTTASLPGMAPLRLAPLAAPFALRAVDLVHPAVLNLAFELGTSTDFPRSQAGVPVSRVDPVTDTVLFEDPADASRHLYLPRYELIARSTNQYAVAIEDRGTKGWALTVALRPVAAPGLDIGGAGELAHTPSVALTYQHPGGGQRELGFDPPQREGGELHAELRLPDMASRDAVIRALSDPAGGTRLVVRRAFDVCVPVEPGQTPPILISREFFAHRLAIAPEPGTEAMSMRALNVTQLRPRDDDGGPGELPDVHPRPRPRPARDPEPARPEQLFRRSAGVLDAQVGDTFTFDRSAHPYVYRAALDAAPGAGRLEQHRVRHGDRTHRYFQDPYKRNLFYYIPDAYRIPRADRGAHAPMLRVRVKGGDDPQQVKMVTDYVAVSVVDPDRLEKAKEPLTAKVPPGFGDPEFERFEVRPERLRYLVRLPQDGGGIAEAPAGAEATLELRSIKHTFTLDPTSFQDVFQTLCGAISTAFEGRIELTLDGDEQPDYIPVLTRSEDFAGDVFELAAPKKVKAPAGADVTLRNVIESPIRLTDVHASIVEDGAEHPATLDGADPVAPLELKAGASATLHVSLAEAGANGVEGAVRVAADAEVVLDHDALWNAILDPTSPIGWRRALTVDGTTLFESSDARAVRVEFDTHDRPVELTRTAPSVDTWLAMPIADFVLGRVDDGDKEVPFRYSCTVVDPPPSDGAKPDPNWLDGSFPKIYASLA